MSEEDRLFPIYNPNDNQEPHEDQTRPHFDFNKAFEEELKKSDPLKTPSGHVFMFLQSHLPSVLGYLFLLFS